MKNKVSGGVKGCCFYPIPSMYGIFNYTFTIKKPNVGKYTIHGWYGY